MPTYTRSNLKTRLSGRLKNKLGMLVDQDASINAAVRAVVNNIDMRGLKRRAALANGLFENVTEYAAPADMKGRSIIGLVPQADKKSEPFTLVPFEIFQKNRAPMTMAVDETDQVRKILAAIDLDADSQVISSLDSTTAGSDSAIAWTGFGDVDDSSIEANSDYYVRGNASLEFDINADASTTAGIQNAGLSTFDITDYFDGLGAAFVYVYINSTTNLTNFKLRLGNDASNYFEGTVTTTHEGNAFASGWNLLRFDFSGMSETGTVDLDACDYAAIYMTKDAAKVSETGYRFDDLVIRRGEFYNVKYYSSYGWENTSGTRLVNSTDDGDYLVCDEDEFELYVEKGVEMIAPELDEAQEAERARVNYIQMRSSYLANTPSESQFETYEYYEDYV